MRTALLAALVAFAHASACVPSPTEGETAPPELGHYAPIVEQLVAKLPPHLAEGVTHPTREKLHEELSDALGPAFPIEPLSVAVGAVPPLKFDHPEWMPEGMAQRAADRALFRIVDHLGELFGEG